LKRVQEGPLGRLDAGAVADEWFDEAAEFNELDVG
jgi:hypothetical protein